MMPERDTTQTLLTRRKLTRAIADLVKAEVTEHLATLGPLFQPHTLFGDHVEGGLKGSTRRADQALKEVQAAYEAIAPAKPFNLRRELATPFGLSSTALEITPVDYVHMAEAASGRRRIMVRRPLTWTLSYSGYSPARLREVLDPRVRGDELQRFIVSHLLLQQVVQQQAGVARILEAMHFKLATETTPEFGELPVTRIAVDISTERPSDDVVIESADLTGMDSFEEVVSADDIALLQDRLKERLLAIVRTHTPDVLAI
jgi:hypothetical protein